MIVPYFWIVILRTILRAVVHRKWCRLVRACAKQNLLVRLWFRGSIQLIIHGAVMQIRLDQAALLCRVATR